MRPLLKGPSMDAKLKATIVKFALGIATAAVIGYIIKLEHKIDAHIDDHFGSEQATTEN